jgi:hypothetical protein
VLFAFKNSKLQGVKIKTSDSLRLKVSEEVLAEISSLVGENNLSLKL